MRAHLLEVELKYIKRMFDLVFPFSLTSLAARARELVGVNVKASSRPGGQSALDGTTDSEGRVMFDAVKLGDYSFSVSKSGYVSGTGSGKVDVGKTTSARASFQHTNLFFFVV